MVEVADSGFTPENIADAEWLWLNMNIDQRKFHELPTAHKAMLCHTAHRHRQAGVQQGLDMAKSAAESVETIGTLSAEAKAEIIAAISKLGMK